MNFEAAKCPSCGASISVPSDMDYVYCSYCGSHVLVKKAININKLEISGTIETKSSTIESMLERGNHFLTLRDYERAERVFSDACDKFPGDHRTWLGMIHSATHGLDVEYVDGYDSNVGKYVSHILTLKPPDTVSILFPVYQYLQQMNISRINSLIEIEKRNLQHNETDTYTRTELRQNKKAMLRFSWKTGMISVATIAFAVFAISVIVTGDTAIRIFVGYPLLLIVIVPLYLIVKLFIESLGMYHNAKTRYYDECERLITNEQHIKDSIQSYKEQLQELEMEIAETS